MNLPNEDDYIYETLHTANFIQEFSKISMSAEGILKKILSDVNFYIFFLLYYN